MNVGRRTLLLCLVSCAVILLPGCSSSGTTTSAYHGSGYRGYYGGPWHSYNPPVYIIDDGIDDIDRPEAVPLPDLGPPDGDFGGMDGGFDDFDF